MKRSFSQSVIAFAIGVVVGVFGLFLGLRQFHALLRCQTGDLAGAVSTLAAGSLESGEYRWIRNARQCDLGEYSIATPVQSGQKGILVFEHGSARRPLFAAVPQAANLFDPEGRRGLRGLLVRSEPRAMSIFNADGHGKLLTLKDEFIALSDPAANRILFSIEHSRSRPYSLSYAAYDVSQGAWVESTVGPDGRIDLRKTEIAGREPKTEFRAGEHWLEVVKRDGQVGTILEGRFMSIAAALAKLGVKSGNLASK